MYETNKDVRECTLFIGSLALNDQAIIISAISGVIEGCLM